MALLEGKLTSLDLFLRRTNLPSKSTSSTPTRPLVRAWWEKLVRLSLSSSFRFLEEPGVDRWLRDAPLWDEGLGDSLSLAGREEEMKPGGTQGSA